MYRYEVSGKRDEQGNSNDTISSSSLFSSPPPLFTQFIRNFCIWRIGDYYHSISFARLRLHPIISSMPISLYIRPWPSTRITYIRIYVYTLPRHSFAPLFISFHFFSFIFRFPLFLFLLIIIIIVIIFISMCQSPDDVCLSTESIIVLHVFAIAKPITCHKCAVAAHFEQRCEASYTLWIMDNRARLFSTFTTREIIYIEKEAGKMNINKPLWSLFINFSEDIRLLVNFWEREKTSKRKQQRFVFAESIVLCATILISMWMYLYWFLLINIWYI